MKKHYMIFLVLFFSCKCRIADPVQGVLALYITRNDYSDKVCVLLSDDKKRIIGGQDPIEAPYRLCNNYVLNKFSCGVNAAFTSISINDFHKYPHSDTTTIIDKDPYIEYYETKIDAIFYSGDNLDTAFVNQIIRTHQIEKYFTRLK